MNTEEKITTILLNVKELMLIDSVHHDRYTHVSKRLEKYQNELAIFDKPINPELIPIMKSIWEALRDTWEIQQLLFSDFANLAESSIDLADVLLEAERTHE